MWIPGADNASDLANKNLDVATFEKHTSFYCDGFDYCQYTIVRQVMNQGECWMYRVTGMTYQS